MVFELGVLVLHVIVSSMVIAVELNTSMLRGAVITVLDTAVSVIVALGVVSLAMFDLALKVIAHL